MKFEIQAKNRETGNWDTFIDGEAKSRRKFMTAMGQSRRVKNEHGFRFWGVVTGHLASLIRDKRQWRTVSL